MVKALLVQLLGRGKAGEGRPIPPQETPQSAVRANRLL